MAPAERMSTCSMVGKKEMPAIRIELMTLSLLVIRSTTEPSGLCSLQAAVSYENFQRNKIYIVTFSKLNVRSTRQIPSLQNLAGLTTIAVLK
jgi:hypothetical protein